MLLVKVAGSVRQAGNGIEQCGVDAIGEIRELEKIEMRRRARHVRLGSPVAQARQDAREMPALVVARVGIEKTGDPVDHGFGERGRVDRKHRRAAEALFDHVESKRLAVGQSGQQIVDAAIRTRHVALMTPEANS